MTENIYEKLGVKSFFPEPVPLGKLQVAAYNPREMPEEEMLKLEKSIEEFGVVEPGVGRRSDLLLIGGHQRTAATTRLLRKKGFSEAEIAAYPFPMILLDISDEDAKILNLALNKIQGQWDYKKLAMVFSSIESISEDRKMLTGYSSVEIDDVMVLIGKGLNDPNESGGGGEGGDSSGGGDGSDDVDAMLARQARKFSFEVATDAQAETCKKALELFGMTGPKNAGAAFASAMAVAARTPPEPSTEPEKQGRTRKKKTAQASLAAQADPEASA